MFKRDDLYHPDNMISEANNMRLILDTKVETQVILQLLVEKGIVTREEVAVKREYVKSQPQYKACYDVLEGSANMGQYYKDHPEEHLKDLMKAKMEGKI